MAESSKNRAFLSFAISAVNGADDTRLQAALSQIAGQSTGVIFNAKPQQGLYTLEGRTESELDSICDRLRDEYHIQINVGPPTAVLLETVRRQAEAEGKYIRQVGGSGNYGHCKLRIEPNEPGKGYEFINDLRDDSVPSEYIGAIDQGIQGAMRQGVLAGFPVIDVRVTLYDGSYHETDSNALAFTFAGSIAFKEAAKKANPVLLEPMMAIEFEVPEDVSEAARNTIYTRRGRVERDLTENGFSEIRAVVPLSELLASDSGIAVYPMEFVGYEPVQDNGFSDEDGSGVTANKPNRPRPSSRSETARPENN